ncbi:MAG: DUF2807 domain-containing protein [Filimonas sp.]|nr:DUF2807 domain-containing protein [Filimonas sp.]
MKKMILAFILVLAATGMQLKAQNVVYDANAEVRKVESFKGIEVSGGISVYLSQGKEQAVAVSVDEQKYISKVRTEVRNGILKIYVESGGWNSWNWGNRKVKAYVTVSTLESLELSGASSMKISGDVNITDLKAEVTGASSLKGSFKGNSMKLETSGASVATLEGSINSLSMEVSGASVVKAYDLTTANCNVDASGASSVSVTATKELKMEASGASSIGYKGDAAIKKIDVSGASTVRKRDS